MSSRAIWLEDSNGGGLGDDLPFSCSFSGSDFGSRNSLDSIVTPSMPSLFPPRYQYLTPPAVTAGRNSSSISGDRLQLLILSSSTFRRGGGGDGFSGTVSVDATSTKEEFVGEGIVLTNDCDKGVCGTIFGRSELVFSSSSSTTAVSSPSAGCLLDRLLIFARSAPRPILEVLPRRRE